MNIIDLAWCVIYLHDKKHDIGYPVIGATIAMTFFLLLYILDITVLLRAFVVDSLPNIEKWQFIIFFAAALAVVYLPFRTKEIRNRKLQKFEDYKKSHPRRYLWRFWLFVLLSVVLLVASFAVLNIMYERQSSV